MNGVLYSTTIAGGATGYCTNNNNPQGCGTVFAFDPNTDAETVLYSFCSQQDCTDGAFPEASLIDVNGALYGTTYTGGEPEGCDPGCGTVFSINPGTGAHKVRYSFGGIGGDGLQPVAGLIAVKGTLYGTTIFGGTSGDGTVFSLKKRR